MGFCALSPPLNVAAIPLGRHRRCRSLLVQVGGIVGQSPYLLMLQEPVLGTPSGPSLPPLDWKASHQRMHIAIRRQSSSFS